jgi:glutamate synthase domain-containing protein 2/glutamate synthase domain-containing protein 1/glutamate synthase domain-containing protein 3
MMDLKTPPVPGQSQGLYDPAYEHDACGLGFIARIDGTRSHDLLLKGLQILENMSHRGACGSDPCTGDGAGLSFQIPHAFLGQACADIGLWLPGPGDYAVGMVFLPTDDAQRAACESMLARLVADESLPFLGWRDVPVDPSRVGDAARDCMPVIRQCFIGRGGLAPEIFERRLFAARKRTEEALRKADLPDRDQFYVASLSSTTIVYKGLLLPRQILGFYLDLADPRVDTAIVVVHDRFSTNTFPAWRLAHPYRYLCHNGEINTLRGNVMWMAAREGHLSSDLFGPELKKLFPILPPGASDSASLDAAIEFLVMGGRSLPHAMMMLVPEAWAGNPYMDIELRAFYDYHNEIVGPWDGPAALVFTDGRVVGATLDPNGLRPARWTLTRDGLVVMSSEAGALHIPPEDVVSQDRLRPGEMILVDTVAGRLIRNDEVKAAVASRKPYREWLATHRINLDDLPPPLNVAQPDHASLRKRQAAFGYTTEELRMVLTPMAVTADEAVGSMGTDTPLAVLSDRPQLLFKYLRQLFSQVTNPPIDPIREQMVMSLSTHIGPEGNLLDEKPEHAKRIRVARPILTNYDLEKIRSLEGGRFASITLPALFRAADGPGALGPAVDALCERASQAVREGYRLLILSDRGVNEEWAAIPSLLATAAVNHHLIREATRTEVGLIVETGEAREVHHFACLLAFGAGTINPFLAFESLTDLADEGYLPEGIDGETAQAKYIKAIDKGLLKIFSKLGITSVRSYLGAQAMEAVGLGPELVNRYFTGLPSRLGGIGLAELGEETLRRHRRAYLKQPRALRRLDPGGEYHSRDQEEKHSWSPEAIASLQESVRNRDFEAFRGFCSLVDGANAGATLRGLLEFVPGDAVPLDEVEPVSDIVKRFCTGAMSYGSIGKEAHEALAQAMNALGGKSNTGEGGEDPARFSHSADGADLNSAIKQVASARFGVTTHYLVNARELQIKISQGAKPGEGGQLPGHKVDEVIARTRHSTPGVSLISPPPHHDIYSIEDLAQLIYDLKCVNPTADVSVKLVSEVGVGTVAAGVAKAYADKVVISGDTGGTGASPLSSIKNAGLPWELGVAEAHQTLVRNGLRDRVRLETDGQLRTGRDVAVAILLGAQEFGFATAPLVSMGCIMMRKCHLNTCPVGIATQDPLLRKNFTGRAEDVVAYLTFVAMMLREVMAGLGFRTIDDMIGRADRLRQRTDVDHWKARTLDLSGLLYQTPVPTASSTAICPDAPAPFLSDALDHELLVLAAPALERGEPVEAELAICNVNRAVGAMLSGEVARRYGPRGLPPDTIRLRFKGSAGQSFGAWCVDGVTLRLEGEANDYLGKGLSGGRIVVVPHREALFDPAQTCLVGNVALYGATGGDVNIRGLAGERFGVRNSGARVVVEGVGHHGCEYMTGGVVVVLGRTGRNFAAGMSGGLAFVYDIDGKFDRRVNRSLVEVGPVDQPADCALLRRMVEDHATRTGSARAQQLLADWDESLARFVKVISTEYRKVLEEREELGSAVRSEDLPVVTAAQG